MSALTGIRVVELAESVAGEYCGKLLADFGAEVIKVERPGGSPTRAMAPIVGDGGGPERSAVFAYLNTNKKSVELDVEASDQLELLHTIIATADAVIGEVSVRQLAHRHPGVVFCSVTPYGIDAPAEMHNATGFTVFQGSGWGSTPPATPIPPNLHSRGPVGSSPTMRPDSTRRCV
jgi:crotonobetainyl-CoA:carnitine CoA-transferase CaiB-like acyl-CoA transferase